MINRQLHIFPCHSSKDRPAVRELYKKLCGESWLDPRLDEEKLLPGQDWHMEIGKAVEVTDVVVVLLSNQSVSREGYVQREFPWRNEFDKNKRNSDEGKKGRTTSVGLYSPQGDTPYGCSDMAGNVWEWTHSGIKAYLYNANDRREDEQKSVAAVPSTMDLTSPGARLATGTTQTTGSGISVFE